MRFFDPCFWVDTIGPKITRQKTYESLLWRRRESFGNAFMSDSSILYPISLYSNLHSSEFLDRPNRRGIYHFTPILSEQISNPAMFLLWYRDRSNSTEQFGDELFWSSKPRRKYRAKNCRLKFLINAFMEDMNPKCNAMIFRMIFSVPLSWAETFELKYTAEKTWWSLLW